MVHGKAMSNEKEHVASSVGTCSINSINIINIKEHGALISKYMTMVMYNLAAANCEATTTQVI